MALNVQNTNSFQFENREYLRNRAKDILNRQGASKENLENILEKTIFTEYSQKHADSQLAVIKASSQITLNNSLKETLKYLNKRQSKRVEKEPVLGELWEIFSKTKLEEDIDFEPIIDKTAQNIFVAA